jgi:hypothetical protein
MSRRLGQTALLATALAILAPHPLVAHGNPIGLVKASIGGAQVTIQYGRPKLKGRDPMKMIEPGEVWQMGADIPTTLESDAPLDFGGSRVPPGKHFLFARLVEPDRWTLVVSSQPIARYQPSAKLAEVPMALATGEKPVAEMTIELTGRGNRGRVEVSWGIYHLRAYFTRAK